MTEAYEKPRIHDEHILLEESPEIQGHIPFAFKEKIVDIKAQLLKGWKKSEGYFYLHPEEFKFGLRDL
jgi:hypothetical protein